MNMFNIYRKVFAVGQNTSSEGGSIVNRKSYREVIYLGLTQTTLSSNILSSPPHLTVSPWRTGRVLFIFQILRNKQTANEQEESGKVLLSEKVHLQNKNAKA